MKIKTQLTLLIAILSFIPLEVRALLPEKVLICGVCRDVEKPLPHTIKIIEQIGALFSDYKVIVYENNSQDATCEILKNWVHENSKVFALSEKIGKSDLENQIINFKEGDFFRPELIARARNIVLERAMSDQYNEFTYVIWMDMDFKIPPAFEGFIEIFTSDKEWDAVLAYGIDPPGTFWDWYAFRDAAYPIGSELLGNFWWYMPKIIHLDKTMDWYPVYSAFGGCGIYKKESIKDCWYSAVVTEDLDEVAGQIIENGRLTKHPQITKYDDLLNQTTSFNCIPHPLPNMPQITDPHAGFLLFSGTIPLIWRMSSFAYQYPSVCEHVPFHASMIKRGHDKIFINPRLVFTYGGY